ncbi:ArsR/SmtB family transcription factor [Bordetella bronchiseptica]|uniref:ArsR/SmtB family transcription factor n=1 Tax=Bordetella bronchiseptica TaxID=518 RepID=UPI0004613FFF|nr:metalloregulator ArsR/SmtB family transcription factor [Bordetella bronchiseptica]AWP74026.1 transcriptional regulator [Bordetella bronchiseptica]KDB93392.1 DNA-binding helix-turn-helix protein [Bordetella bronchiseptica D993]KDB97858.1 DNA-binding helix-turn-helix protein [Bordetella bronchiseptica E010]KDD33220.1 DNA-binding helix-turn-helix protein [Bordetella bronchiseptica MBORD839]KFJ61254.1 bacterial regulatory, arsR family protein [Bordetella bronchiseptica]
METNAAIKALVALGHALRLTAFRLLVQAGAEGVAAGQLAQAMGIAPSSLSFHLKELVQAGLLEARQDGRFVIYAARYDTMAGLIAYLTDNCCQGAPCDAAPCTREPRA